MQSRIKHLLEEKNLTASRFADLIEVNASAVSHILNGRSKPGFDVLEKISKAFPELDMNWLISGRGSMLTETEEAKPYTGKVAASYGSGELPFPDLVMDRQEVTENTGKVRTGTDQDRKLTRIILFFDDGSFESYGK